MDGKVGTQLAESILEAAGSLHQLQEELDRISLRHYGSAVGTPTALRSSTYKTKKKRKQEQGTSLSVRGSNGGTIGFAGPTREYEPCDQDTISLESESHERPSSPSSSSHFDSAIGSLHSQTDNESLSSQLFLPPTTQSYPQPPPPRRYEGEFMFHRPLSPTLPASPESRHSNRVVEATVEEYFSPQLAMPMLVTAEHAPRQQNSLECDRIVDNSLQSSTVTVLGTQVQLRQRVRKQKVHQQLTAEDTRKHFKWLQTCESGGTTGTGIKATVDVTSTNSRNELESGGSSSTVVEEAVERDSAAVDNEMWHEEHLCILSQDVGSVWVAMEPKGMALENYRCTVSNSSGKRDGDKRRWSSTQDNLTPQTSPPVPQRYPSSTQVNMPHRYQTGPSSVLQEGGERQRRPPRRNTSILQRLRRRRGSFRQDVRPRRRTPVQRSLSDRFVYHLKKKWEDHEEKLYPISAPSLLRPIGRLLRTYAGRLHIIQLHKPPDGRYGIYITQGVEQKVFISRFANATAEKFYAGLLSPGDEIVSVNKQKIRGKSLDSVHNMLSQLDSVIIAVVPVTAHRNW